MTKTVRPYHCRRKHLRAACVLVVLLLGFNLAAAAAPVNACGGAVCCGHCGPTGSGPAQLKAMTPGGCCNGGGNSSCTGDSGRSAERDDQPAAIGFSATPDPCFPAVLAAKPFSGSPTRSSEFQPQVTLAGSFHSPPLFLSLGNLRR